MRTLFKQKFKQRLRQRLSNLHKKVRSAEANNIDQRIKVRGKNRTIQFTSPFLLFLSFFFFSIFYSFPSFGMKKVIVQEGAAKSIKVASLSLNHFSVEDDRILSIQGEEGLFIINKDETLGHIYFKPILEHYTQPISLFLTTEKGRTISLLLTPAKIKPTSIRFFLTGTSGTSFSKDVIKDVKKDLSGLRLNKEKRKNPSLSSSSLSSYPVINKSTSYEGVMIHLIKAMHRNIELDGFVIEEVPNQRIKEVTGVIKRLRVLYRGTTPIEHKQDGVFNPLGKALTGEIWQVENHTGKQMVLSESSFYEPGVRAVSILTKTLPKNPKKGRTTVYRVVDDE